MQTLNIIGAGRVGKTLGRLLADSGQLEVLAVCNRTQASAEHAVVFIGQGQAITKLSDLSPADWTMVATPDDKIAKIADELQQYHVLIESGCLFHCSGTLPSSLFLACQNMGCQIASVHPVKSFADPKMSITNFLGTACGIEGDHGAAVQLAELFRGIGAKPFTLKTESKLQYHAAMVMASNYLVTLMDVAIDLCHDAGIDENKSYDILQPIVQSTVDNVFSMGTTRSLTGPIARGDVETVAKHLSALPSCKPPIFKTV